MTEETRDKQGQIEDMVREFLADDVTRDGTHHKIAMRILDGLDPKPDEVSVHNLEEGNVCVRLYYHNTSGDAEEFCVVL